MKLKNRKIRTQYRSIVKQEIEKRTDCPDTDRLIESFTDNLDESQKFKLIDHISECNACLEKFDLVEQIFKHSKKMALGKKKFSLNENEMKEFKELSKGKILELEEQYRISQKKVISKPGDPVLFFPKIPVKYLSIAAALIIVILGAVFIFRTPPDLKNDTLRGVRTEEFYLIAPRGEIKTIPLIFRWNSVQGAEDYEVRLMNSELIKIWHSDKTSKTQIELPRDIHQKLKQDKIYYWKVTAYLKSGDTTKSKLVEFESKTN